MWQKRSAYRVLMGKPDIKKPTGKPRIGWEYYIKTI
jgi:hypothetical protein